MTRLRCFGSFLVNKENFADNNNNNNNNNNNKSKKQTTFGLILEVTQNWKKWGEDVFLYPEKWWLPIPPKKTT